MNAPLTLETLTQAWVDRIAALDDQLLVMNAQSFTDEEQQDEHNVQRGYVEAECEALNAAWNLASRWCAHHAIYGKFDPKESI